MKGGYARRSTPGFVFYGLFLVVFAVFRKEDAPMQIGAPTGSGSKLFDNSKAGNFTPITVGRLRSA